MANTNQTPYLAGITGKHGPEELALEQRIDALPEKLKTLLFESGTNEKVFGVLGTQVPEQLLPAVMKMTFFLIMGDAKYEDVPALLQRSGFTQPQAVAAASALRQLADQITAAKIAPPVPKPVPPLTVRRPVAGPIGKPPAIIDLRQTKP